MPSDVRDRLVQLLRLFADLPIGPPEVLAPRRAQREARRLRLCQPLLDRSVAAQLAEGQIA